MSRYYRRTLVKFFTSVLMTAALMPLRVIAGDAAAFKSDTGYYLNTRLNYSIAFPYSMFKAESGPENGDGRIFISKDGVAKLLVYGIYEINSDGAKGEYVRNLPGGEYYTDVTAISYKRLGLDWFVLSGRENGNIFYRKTIVAKGNVNTFELKYPESHKAIYEPMLKGLLASFSVPIDVPNHVKWNNKMVDLIAAPK